jgi:hypothetical protein
MTKVIASAVFALVALTVTAQAAQVCCDLLVCCDGGPCCD